MALSVTQADGPLRIVGAVVIGTINASGQFEQYVGPSYKASCRCATTGSITIATGLNAGDTIDGITLVAGDRVLVKNQAAPAQNGIYVAGVTPARSTDFDEWSEIPGAVVGVTEGSTQADTAWLCTSDSGGTIGSTAINFSAFGTSIATPVSSANGGTGINNAGTLTIGLSDIVFTTSGSTTITLPLSGTMATTSEITFAAIKSAAGITAAGDGTYPLPTSISIVGGLITAIS